jgi:nucleoid-associated protein YgaU
MTTSYVEYTTKEGDRWDLISYKFYGVPDKYYLIQEANEKEIPPSLLYSPVLPAGLKLKIPVLEEQPTKELPPPPWKT